MEVDRVLVLTKVSIYLSLCLDVCCRRSDGYVQESLRAVVVYTVIMEWSGVGFGDEKVMMRRR